MRAIARSLGVVGGLDTAPHGRCVKTVFQKTPLTPIDSAVSFGLRAAQKPPDFDAMRKLSRLRKLFVYSESQFPRIPFIGSWPVHVA
jgi:hypothetical protein